MDEFSFSLDQVCLLFQPGQNSRAVWWFFLSLTQSNTSNNKWRDIPRVSALSQIFLCFQIYWTEQTSVFSGKQLSTYWGKTKEMERKCEVWVLTEEFRGPLLQEIDRYMMIIGCSGIRENNFATLSFQLLHRPCVQE